MTKRRLDETPLTLLSEAAASREIGWSRATLRKRALAGLVPHIIDPLSGRRLYSPEALIAWQRRLGELAAERGAA